MATQIDIVFSDEVKARNYKLQNSSQKEEELLDEPRKDKIFIITV